jgi:hypothetical protein
MAGAMMDRIKIRAWQINDQWEDHAWYKEEWFDASLAAFSSDAPSKDSADYDYIQIVPMAHYRAYFSGNGGAQAFRHKGTGWTFPDHCRERGGCPEMWKRSYRHQVTISDDSPVWSYLVDW